MVLPICESSDLTDNDHSRFTVIIVNSRIQSFLSPVLAVWIASVLRSFWSSMPKKLLMALQFLQTSEESEDFPHIILHCETCDSDGRSVDCVCLEKELDALNFASSIKHAHLGRAHGGAPIKQNPAETHAVSGLRAFLHELQDSLVAMHGSKLPR